MVDLTTAAAVKAQLHIIGVNGTVDPVDDALISGYVSQASQMFSTQTRRQFYATGGATLTYDIAHPDIYGSKLFFNEDVLVVERVINGDNTVIPATNYRTLPVNYNPKYGIQLLQGATTWWTPGQTNGFQNAIQVQGSLGFCATGAQPDDVTLAVTRLAAFLYVTRDSSGDVVKFADGTMQIPANAPELVLKTIQRYQRVRVFP